MISKTPPPLPAIDYEAEAQAYLRSLPLEHFMEATKQATQRKITVESLDLLASRRSDVRVFNELLVQYPRPGQRKVGQVVPDNMVVLTEERIGDMGSYDVPNQPAPPFWVLDYVSASNKRKDYEDSHRKYEQELKVPYYLVFHPDEQDLRLYRHNQRRYVKVKPNEHGRYAIPQMDLEIGLLDGRVRYWYQAELLPLPGDFQKQLEAARRQTEDAKREARESHSRAEESDRRAEDLQRCLEAAEQELAKLRDGRP